MPKPELSILLERACRRAMTQRLAAGLTSVAVIAAVSGCGGSSPDTDPPPGRDFVFEADAWPVSERVVVRITDARVIDMARAELRLPIGVRLLHPAGRLAGGNGGHNGSWNWHLREVQLVQVSIELCDGRPSMVEADLNYWLARVGSFCPWGARVVAEL